MEGEEGSAITKTSEVHRMSSYVKACRSIVTIEWKGINTADHCMGCVIYNSGKSTFVLTGSFIVKKPGQLTLHFMESSTNEVQVLVFGEKYSILVAPLQDCDPIKYRGKPAKRESVMLFAAVGEPHMPPNQLEGFAVLTSCSGKNRSGTYERDSDKYFLVTCTYHSQGEFGQTRLQTSPIFDLEAGFLGLVFADCGPKDSLLLCKTALHGAAVGDVVRELCSISLSTVEEVSLEDCLLQLEEKENEKRRLTEESQKAKNERRKICVKRKRK